MRPISFHPGLDEHSTLYVLVHYALMNRGRFRIIRIPLQFQIKLTGGESAGFPVGVTYAEESPPSTVKSVPVT